MKDFHFAIDMEVRDYECDIQGIVNNSVYQNYLEHCRHKFLNTAGLDFAQLHNEGIDAVVFRAEIDYKYPLKPGDEFVVQLKLAKQGHLRLIFNQEIIRKPDNKLIVKGRITTVLTQNGKPISPALLEGKFADSGIIMVQE